MIDAYFSSVTVAVTQMTKVVHYACEWVLGSCFLGITLLNLAAISTENRDLPHLLSSTTRRVKGCIVWSITNRVEVREIEPLETGHEAV